MHNILELEERWKKYRAKKIRRVMVSSILSLFAILLVAYTSLFYQDISKKVKDIYTILIDKKESNNTKVVDSSAIKIVTTKEQNSSNILIPKKMTHEIELKDKLVEIQNKFLVSQDPQDSLFLAREYYKLKDYEKAELWAINTNNLDGEIEESWLIFAKSRAKQGYRVDAITVLQAYYDETNSKDAKELLDKLRKGQEF